MQSEIISSPAKGGWHSGSAPHRGRPVADDHDHDDNRGDGDDDDDDYDFDYEWSPVGVPQYQRPRYMQDDPIRLSAPGLHLKTWRMLMMMMMTTMTNLTMLMIKGTCCPPTSQSPEMTTPLWPAKDLRKNWSKSSRENFY